MRIFVSSSFEDLREHRAAAIRVLRQLGHEVIAMEDMVAGSSAPLNKVIEMVDRSEAYVGLFAWRYGHVPGSAGDIAVSNRRAGDRETDIPNVRDATYGATSITHFEYLRAKERDLPILAFVLADDVPLNPLFVDGFDRSRPGAPVDASRIRALRAELQEEKVVSWFTTPSDLEARVAAAVTSVGLGRQIDIQPAIGVGGGAGDESIFDSAGYSVTSAVAEAGALRRAIRIDLGTTWWSTRLFLVAALLERLSQTRRVLVVEGSSAHPPSPEGFPRVAFVGQLSTAAIVRVIEPMAPELGRFQRWLQQQPADPRRDPEEVAQRYLDEGWASAFTGGPPAGTGRRRPSVDAHEAERAVKIDLTRDRLRQWFGDAMLEQAVEVRDLRRASIVDLIRVIDYPNDFVPVLSEPLPLSDEPVGVVDVIDKAALTARLAHSYLTELKERARIS